LDITTGFKTGIVNIKLKCIFTVLSLFANKVADSLIVASELSKLDFRFQGKVVALEGSHNLLDGEVELFY